MLQSISPERFGSFLTPLSDSSLRTKFEFDRYFDMSDHDLSSSTLDASSTDEVLSTPGITLSGSRALNVHNTTQSRAEDEDIRLIPRGSG